jgi:hypothetical protein
MSLLMHMQSYSAQQQLRSNVRQHKDAEHRICVFAADFFAIGAAASKPRVLTRSERHHLATASYSSKCEQLIVRYVCFWHNVSQPALSCSTAAAFDMRPLWAYLVLLQLLGGSFPFVSRCSLCPCAAFASPSPQVAQRRSSRSSSSQPRRRRRRRVLMAEAAHSVVLDGGVGVQAAPNDFGTCCSSSDTVQLISHCVIYDLASIELHMTHQCVRSAPEYVFKFSVFVRSFVSHVYSSALNSKPYVIYCTLMQIQQQQEQQQEQQQQRQAKQRRSAERASVCCAVMPITARESK